MAEVPAIEYDPDTNEDRPQTMELFSGSLLLWDALDIATSSSRWRFFVPIVFGAAGGLALGHLGDGSTESVFAGSATLLAGVGVGAVWQRWWKASRPVARVESPASS